MNVTVCVDRSRRGSPDFHTAVSNALASHAFATTG